MAPVASPTIQQYFTDLKKEVRDAYDIAKAARLKGFDPEEKPEIMLANNMAERVIGLISTVAPQLLDSGVTKRIEDLEEEYGLLDWRVGFRIAEEVAKQKFCQFKDKQEAIETGIRTGFSYLTLGIVAAPLEGFVGIKIKKRKDGKEYFALQYAGPVRGAGGTASSVSVILSDYVRVKMGYAPYDPQEKEVSRNTGEIHDYHERVTNLQYHPSSEELKFMLSHLPIEVDGDPTERIEVSNYKDMERIDTNLIRGGMCLVVAEGLCQKAPKLWKRLGKWGKEMELEWGFLKEFLELKEKIHAGGHDKKATVRTETLEEKPTKKLRKRPKPNDTFIADLVAGRPILTHPVSEGGFRLRYGRTRMTGFSASALHPATLVVLDKFIAIGTQLKVERPGKAATISNCETIDGPIVRLHDGSLVQLNSRQEALRVLKEIQEIVFLGDILFNYGDFSENGHGLVPCGYCPEWWAKELEAELTSKQETASESLQLILDDPLRVIPTIQEALDLSSKYSVALHPHYTFFWDLLSPEEFTQLLKYLQSGKIKKTAQAEILKWILPYSSEQKDFLRGKALLDKAGLVHKVINKQSIVIEQVQAKVLCAILGISSQEELLNYTLPSDISSFETAIDLLNSISPVFQRDKAGTFIGARMGRPEKAKMRKLKGSPHVLFPVGDEGDRLRCFQAALKAGKVTSQFPLYYCNTCKKETVYFQCETCHEKALAKGYCHLCGEVNEGNCRHGEAKHYNHREIDINHYFNAAKQQIGEKLHPDLIKGVKGTSNKKHVVEHLSKGILRAKHSIYVNKDGTTRFDCTEMPITHFKAKEIRTSVERLREIGYTKDIHGNELVDSNQVCELRPQDVIVPGTGFLDESAAQVLMRVAQCIDEMLVKLYGLEPYYNVNKPEDLVGHYVIGLAPHISAGSVGRIIGFSETQTLLAHPMFHAGMRRDCDGDEACVMMLLDAFLNFSKHYLPSSRGSTMDACLVLTSILSPAEVDDQVLGVDCQWSYPLEFYQAAQEMKKPWEVKWGPEQKKIDQLNDRLGTEKQYEDIGYTHHVENFNESVSCSAYKTLPSMNEKLFGQMEIAQKVRAVKMGHVAQLVIQKHFISDLKGNFRKFSMQGFRCVGCNAKYRRPPISNRCSECKTGKIIFTISEGSVVKYLEPSLELCRKYEFSPYLKETLELLKYNIDTVFGKPKDKQVGLASFMGK